MVVSIQMVLAVLAVCFVHMALLERHVGNHFADKVASRLCALAGIERAIAGLAEEWCRQGYSDWTNAMWRYPPSPETPLLESSQATFGTPGERATSYEQGSVAGVRYASTLAALSPGSLFVHCYALKIVDCNGQLNLNSHIAIPEDPLQPADQASANATLQRLVKNLALLCDLPDADAVRAAETLTPLTWDPHYRDANAPLPRRWINLKDAADALSALAPPLPAGALQRLLARLTVSAWIDTKTFVVRDYPLASEAIPRYLREARSPININVASEEVIAAVLWQLEAAPVLLDNQSVRRAESNDGVTAPGKLYDETETGSRHRRVRIVAVPTRERAMLLARKIAQFREARPFTSRAVFNKFVETWSCGNGEADDLPYDGDTVDQLHPHANAPEIVDRTLGRRLWQEACWDIIRSNADANVVDNCFNASRHAAHVTVKSDLFRDDAGQRRRTHSTEFCFGPAGRFAIAAVGRLLFLDCLQSETLIESEISLGSLFAHTTQADFETPALAATPIAPMFADTTSYPGVVGKNLDWRPDLHVGRIEAIVQHDDNVPPYLYVAPPRGKTPLLPASNSERFLTAPSPLQTMRVGSELRDPQNNLQNDGLFSDLRQVADIGDIRYHSLPAMPTGAQRGQNYVAGARFPYYKGTLEFWVKLNDHSNTQLGCGLFSATLVNPNPPYREDAGEADSLPHPYSEGVQFYVWKNSLGQLRFSRIYFCLTYDGGGSLIGTHFLTDADGWNAGTGSWRAAAQSGGLYFPCPRQDVVVRTLDWPAHSWHHVAVSWSSLNVNQPMQVVIDGARQDTAVQQVEFTPSRSDPEFCLLNELAPRDCINIGGFFRPQPHTRFGLFKFARAVHFPANATIAYARVYDSPLTPPYYPRCGDASYTHNFVMPRPGVLGVLVYTASPARESGQPHVTARARVYDSGGSESGEFATPDTPGEAGYEGDGLPLGRTRVTAGARVQYTLDLHALLNGNDNAVVEDVNLRLVHVSFLYYQEICN